MVDRDIKKNRSLSADSDLHSAYETYRSGDYKSALAFVEKKLQKLNSQLDKFNFNILLALIYSKTNRLQDSRKLCEALKSEMISYNYFNLVPEICEYFKNILRELNEDKLLKEIFEAQNKNVNLQKIDKDHQKQILKELTMNQELNELYSKINIFLKSENEPNIELLNLLKYEVVYILCFKLQKLSKFIATAIFKEMNSKFDTLKSQKGFLDIYIKFLIGLNDTENFLKLFEGEKQNAFTNAPIDDLLVNIYFNQSNQEEKLINHLINSIRSNLDKCNFNNFSRLIAFAFKFFEHKQIEESEIAFCFSAESTFDLCFAQAEFDSFSFAKANSLKDSFLGFFSFISFIRNSSEIKRKNFNSWKSSVLALLMFLHFVMIKFGKITANGPNADLLLKKIEGFIAPLALELLECSVNKQSILMEISKYFVYLTEEKRNEILDKFAYDVIGKQDNTNNNLTNEEKEKIIFYQKLKKMLSLKIGFPSNFAHLSISTTTNENNENKPIESISLSKELDKVEAYITEITALYFLITKNSNKLEKGERLLGDDLIILITESFFELTNKFDLNAFSLSADLNEKHAKIAYNTYAVTFIAYELSPYNYDISLMFLRLCGYLGLNTKFFTILTTMNLKGPQFESVSYIAHKYFLNSQFKQGLVYLYGNLDKWQKDNKRCSRKTLWKMFTGRNFWDTEEIIEFLNENENSYFKFLNEFHQISVEYVNSFLLAAQDNVKKIELFNCVESLKFYQTSLQAKIENQTLNKNQDVLISVFKYKYIPYLACDLEALKNNRNYDQKNFVFKFSIDKLNKDNLIFENTPGYKNNFFMQDDISVFGNFENEHFLNLNFLTNILKVNLKFYFNADLNQGKQTQIELDQAYVKAALEKAVNLISDENSKKILESQKICKSEFNFVFELEKILVNLFKFESESGSDAEKLEANFTQLTDLLGKLIELTIKSQDFASFKSNYKSFNHVHKTSLVNKLRIFARFYLPAFTLLVAKLINFIGINKAKFQNATSLKSSLNSLFKSAFMNFFANLESLNNDSDEANKIEGFLNVKEFIDFNNLPAKIKMQIRKNVEENTREIKDIAKSLTAFIREML